MKNPPDITPGQLVEYRNRTWIVLPSDDRDILQLKPLGGADAETTGVYLPLGLPQEEPHPTSLQPPQVDDLGPFDSAQLLFEAARLSFRNASGPFRCMGKLSFRPRAYQVVPLVMALQQDPVRLLIADDVGIGKTVEALMILKEMLERGDVRRFAVLCLPHLCEQWQRELKDKLDIEAEIIRSSTVAALTRTLPLDDRSLYHHLPAQVISIDYVKGDRHRRTFLQDCPELVIVDEAHACALPSGAASPSKQQRHHLLDDIASRPGQHLLLLTATPHSGKDDEFRSLLGLLRPEFGEFDLEHLPQKQREQLAHHFIQRKRANIERWHRRNGRDETTPFPQREPIEIAYTLSPQYQDFFNKVLRFAREITQADSGKYQRIRYWAALALLRGVVSSPATAVEMLRRRQTLSLEQDDLEALAISTAPFRENLEATSDASQRELLDAAELGKSAAQSLEALCAQAQSLHGEEQDWKLRQLAQTLKQLLREGLQPIVFCRFIASAGYVEQALRRILPPDVRVQAVTSEQADEQRREIIDRMGEANRRVLVATDCLSEGINLQDLFSAVVHYDLPWNPNRIEQREGRVDRFGQQAPVVKTVLMYGKDNPIDRKVFEILVRKVMEIQRTIGVQISIGEENTQLMEQVIREVLLQDQDTGVQLNLFAESQIQNELDAARRKAENLRSIFAHESVPKVEIEAQLDRVDEAIGDAEAVERFVRQAVLHLGGQVRRLPHGLELQLDNLPAHIREHFPAGKPVQVSVLSPTPPGYRYLGRNHHFVEQLCQFILALAFEPRPGFHRLPRAAVIQTDAVTAKTTLIQFRVRNVIQEQHGQRQVIAEEMFLWGYRNGDGHVHELDYCTAKQLLLEARSRAQLSPEAQRERFFREVARFEEFAPRFREVAKKRALELVEAHEGFKELVGGKRYKAVHPVLPPDLLGVYVLMPHSTPHP